MAHCCCYSDWLIHPFLYLLSPHVPVSPAAISFVCSAFSTLVAAFLCISPAPPFSTTPTTLLALIVAVIRTVSDPPTLYISTARSPPQIAHFVIASVSLLPIPIVHCYIPSPVPSNGHLVAVSSFSNSATSTRADDIVSPFPTHPRPICTRFRLVFPLIFPAAIHFCSRSSF